MPSSVLSLTPAEAELKLSKMTFHHNVKVSQKQALGQGLYPRRWAECDGAEGVISGAG